MKELHGAGALIIQGNTILVIKRVDAPFANMYALPGGQIEKGELAYSACIRETKEETGLDIQTTQTDYLGDIEFLYNDVRCIVHAYLGKLVGGQIKIQKEEVSEVKWMEANQALIEIEKGGFPKDQIAKLKVIFLNQGLDIKLV